MYYLFTGSPNEAKSTDAFTPAILPLERSTILFTSAPIPEHQCRHYRYEELIALQAVREHFDTLGKPPRSENLLAYIRQFALFGEYSKKNVPQLFKGLWKNNTNITMAEALRREIGLDANAFTADECIAIIRFVYTDLNEKRLTAAIEKALANGESVDDIKFESPMLPTAEVFNEYRASRVLVPTTGTIVPSYSTLNLRIFGETGHTLAESIERALPEVKISDILDQLQVKVTRKMLEKDYRDAMAWSLIHRPEHVRNGLLTYEDLDIYAEESNGLGSQRYKNFITTSKETDNPVILNDIREDADCKRDPAKDKYSTRRLRVVWTPETIIESYIELWKGFGLENEPPTIAELNYYSKRQTDIINKTKTIDTDAFASEGLPPFLVPNVSGIEYHFKTLTALLGTIDSDDKYKITVILPEKRLYEMHKSTKTHPDLPTTKQILAYGRNTGSAPPQSSGTCAQVRKYIAPKIAPALATLTPNCPI